MPVLGVKEQKNHKSLKFGSQINILGHKTWKLKKVPDVAYGPSFYPSGGEIELIFALWAAVSEIQADFENKHIWA